jgi:7-cyano-7-deazaguanine synthase in queuosine biosynthesis
MINEPDVMIARLRRTLKEHSVGLLTRETAEVIQMLEQLKSFRETIVSIYECGREGRCEHCHKLAWHALKKHS